MLNPLIFRNYDIRGIAETDLTSEVVYKIGRAYGTYITKGKVCVGQDVRLSSKRIENALINGLIDSGIEVINLGVIPTPVLYFSVFYYNYDGGIMITGSHNPKEYNGFKLMKGKETLHTEEIQKIKKIVIEENFIKGKGNLSKYDPVPDYINFIKNKVKIERPKKIIIDPGNGTCGYIVKKLFEELGCSVECIYCEPDGNFPNHLPDPTIPEFMTDLIKKVKTEKFDFGIGYDGDGDRIGVIDDTGEIIWGDKLLGILSKPIIEKHKGATIIFEVKCSEGLVEYIKKLGGNPLMWKTGHSLIKAKMKETNALIAGEMSGHMFFADDYYGYDDAIFASIRLLEILSKENKPLSELVKEIPYYYSTPEIRIDSDDRIKFALIEKIKEYYKDFCKKATGKVEVIDIDGVRVKFPDGWGLIRASNTQPVLVLRFEAKTQARLEEIKNEMLNKLNEISKNIK